MNENPHFVRYKLAFQNPSVNPFLNIFSTIKLERLWKDPLPNNISKKLL
jgi:hypothetical protein